MSEIDRSSGALVTLARTRTVTDCFGRFFCNLGSDEPSSLLTEIAMTHSKSTVKSLIFSCGMRWLRVAMDIRSATPHHLERRCLVCRAPKELKFAGNLAKAQSCRAKPLLFTLSGKTFRFFSRFERHDSFLFLLPSSGIQVTCSACAAVIESCYRKAVSVPTSVIGGLGAPATSDLVNCDRRRRFSQNERRRADLRASDFLIFTEGLSYDLSKFSNDLICTTPRLCQNNLTPVALRGRGTTSASNCFPATG